MFTRPRPSRKTAKRRHIKSLMSRGARLVPTNPTSCSRKASQIRQPSHLPWMRSGRQWSQLRQRVHALPPELFQTTLQHFLHSVSEPGKIYLGAENLSLRVFGALDRVMYTKQRSIFLSESVWVIGQGNHEEAMGILDRIPLSLMKSMKRTK